MKLKQEHWNDDDGNPAGGVSSDVGLKITWQDGPVGDGKEQTGALVENVIEAVLGRMAFYQGSKFNCPENTLTVEHLEAALKAQHSRTRAREEQDVEGTHKTHTPLANFRKSDSEFLFTFTKKDALQRGDLRIQNGSVLFACPTGENYPEKGFLDNVHPEDVLMVEHDSGTMEIKIVKGQEAPQLIQNFMDEDEFLLYSFQTQRSEVEGWMGLALDEGSALIVFKKHAHDLANK